MTATTHGPRLVMKARTAADLMHSNPISIQASANIREVLALLTDRGFGVAPVIDEAGRPVGVVSRSDILIHEREQVKHTPLLEEISAPAPNHRFREGYSVEVVDPTEVRDMMTPVVFTVTEDTPAYQVVEQMLSLKVHHLFVVDSDCALIGVISTLDVLRALQKE